MGYAIISDSNSTKSRISKHRRSIEVVQKKVRSILIRTIRFTAVRMYVTTKVMWYLMDSNVSAGIFLHIIIVSANTNRAKMSAWKLQKMRASP